MILLVVLALALTARAQHDFLTIAALRDGERVVHLRKHSLRLRYTSASNYSDGLILVEVSDGHRFLQLIFQGFDQLVDCDEVTGPSPELDTFLSEFDNRTSAACLTGSDGVESGSDCYRRSKSSPKYEESPIWLDDESVSDDDSGGMMSLVPQIRPYLNYKSLSRRCSKLHKLIIEKATDAQEHRTSRQKRGLGEMLRMPGTKWCGKGYSAKKYHQVGSFAAADRCCRKHDLACPYYIPAMSKRYDLFNWRVNTLMHCSCDRRFRSCLKVAGTASANLVGKIFFNVVQTNCFVLKRERQCYKKSWWGKCHRYIFRKKAYIRPNKGY